LQYYQIPGYLHQATADLKLAVTKEWSLRYLRRLDFILEQDFEQTYEVRYEGQCWGIRFFYTDTLREDAFFVAFSLGGLGEILGWGQTKSVETR
jgi:LPS-assembly protein